MTPLDAMRSALARLAIIDPAPLAELTALTNAIAELESAEPSAYIWTNNKGWEMYASIPHDEYTNIPLFLHPAQSRDKPNFTDLLKEANEIVKGKSVYKRFMESTPLENDVPVWMADFAMEHGIYQPVEPAQSRGAVIEECAVLMETKVLECDQKVLAATIRALKSK